ncbi:putative transcription regulator mTERF family [Helianthus annuus]|nr:putative transcription regulator mTERF family [Helianthus annuus]KAJ0782679.1 putative transcription regulator mTERF family [Helianthus annuus]KAJ0956287.1 putative transcription regulator mTERF family [Helianthus annuus]
MNNLLKRQTCSVLKWAFANLAQNNLTPSKTTIKGTGFSYITQNPRFYGRKAHIQSNDLIKDNSVIEAQDALIEYLHSTRNLQYVDAENISRNSPNFLEKLLKSVENEKDAKQSLRRLFCYHPINEFEPFFESMGMKPCEYSSLLPRDMMYLADDQRLLANYHVLCEYGVSPNKIGKIYIEAHEVFGYDHGILLSKLNSLQAKGFTQSGVAKLVSSCPNVLVNDDFLKVLEALTDVGIVHSWFEENILEENSYNWSKILEHLCLIKGLCCSNEDLKELLYNNSTILLEDSGDTAISLIVFLIKFGASIDDVLTVFKQLPQIKIRVFQSNLKNCHQFLRDIEMDDDDIANIIRTHSHVLGSCRLKSVKTLFNGLNSGKKRLCDIIKENPLELKKWVIGKKLKALPKPKNNFSEEKIRFLSNLGFVENSDEMNKALKLFRGNGGELQERFDCLVNAGLTGDDVAEMVKLAPQVINQTKEVIEMKISFLVNDLGYNVSSLVKYPAFLSYSIQKIKHRFAMYKWLTDRGKVNGNLALSTVLATSDKKFVRVYVDRDPEGLTVWDKYKKQFFSDEKAV